MDGSMLAALLLSCAPQVDAATAQALIAAESAGNPHAIGVVGGALQRQPATLAEALATARALALQGFDYSMGLAQINARQARRLGLTVAQAFEPCTNLQAMQHILSGCLSKVRPQPARTADGQAALRRALSCYYSGNFETGFRHGYVARVVAAAARQRHATR